MYLNQEMEALKASLKYADKHVSTVSINNVDWHIYHALLVISGVCALLKQSTPQDYQPKFSFLKFGIMATGIIPRGKAKAPKTVVPPTKIDSDEILQLFSKVEHQLNSLEQLDKNHFYKHHLFGDLNLKKSVRFLGIHTRHHLEIIRDIEVKSE